MKRFVSILTFLTVLSVFGLAINAQATPYIPQLGPSYFQFNNIEQIDQSSLQSISVPGINPLTGVKDYGKSDNWGLVNLSSIQDGAVSTPHNDISGGAVLWFDNGPIDPDTTFNMTVGQITGIFYDIDITSGTTATGGIMDLYWREPDVDMIDDSYLDGTALPTDATVADFIGTDDGTDTTFLVRLFFDTGIIDGNNVTTILSSTDITGPSYISGHADSYASVDTSVVGAWTSILNSDWFWVDTNGNNIRGEADELRDIRFSNFYNQQTLWDSGASIKGLRSNDPGRSYVVPEPCTMLLLGSGLLGLGGIARRKFNKR